MSSSPFLAGAFVGRQLELERLERVLDAIRRTGHGGFVSIRGRRRVGKSRLVDELTRRAGCPSVFYTATQAGSEREIDRFLDAVARSDLPVAADVRAGVRADGWEAALGVPGRGARRERAAASSICR